MVKPEMLASVSPSRLGAYVHLSHGLSLTGKEKLGQLYPGRVTYFIHRQIYPYILVHYSHPIHKFIVNPLRPGSLHIQRDGKCLHNNESEKDCALLQYNT